MSLLHDALKKAEQENKATETTALVESETKGKSSISVVVLSLIASLLVLWIVYQKVVRKPGLHAPTPVVATAVAPAVSPESSVAAGTRLIQEADEKIKAERYAEAADLLEKAILSPLSTTQEVETYNNLGFVLKKLGRQEDALQRYQKALSLDPQCAECRNNLGVLYLSRRDFVEAETHFSEAMRLKPDYADPYFHMALLKEASGDFIEARKNYVRYMELAQGLSAEFLAKIQERIALIEAR